MRSLAAISIHRPVFAWMMMLGLIVFGLISFHRLGISQLPDVDFPVVSVTLTLNGAAPEVMESQVLDPIEDSIMQIDGIRSVTSSAQQSSATIAVEFELTQDINVGMQEIENHINQVKNLLPVNLFPAVLRKINPEDQPIMWMTLSSDDPNVNVSDMMIYARNYLFDQFGVVSGVGNVLLGGYVDPALRVWLDLHKLTPLNLTSEDVVQAIQEGHIETPSGRVGNESTEYNIRTLGEAATPAEFASIAINERLQQSPNYRVIRLSDVADVEMAVADVRRISRYNGQRAVGLGIVKQHGSNAVAVAENVRKKLAEIAPLVPKGYKVAVRSDNTRFIKQSVNELVFTLILSALLTSVVCYLFLGSWTSTVNILFAIPTSIVGAFTVLFFFGFTLNTFTLLGLALAVGIVVDDAIMMLENIVRHQRAGESRRDAALHGAEEITFAAMASTIAVVAIFLPVVFMVGIIGKYFYQYGITVTAAVLLSFLEAVTLTPMRCSTLLGADEPARGPAKHVEKAFDLLTRLYERALRVLLDHRWKTVVATLGVCLISLLITKRLPAEMMPPQDQAQILFRFKLPVGTSIEATDAVMRKVEALIRSRPEVAGVYSAVGGFGADAVNQAIAFTNLVDRGRRKLSQSQVQRELQAEIRKLYPHMETVAQDLSLRGMAATRGFPVEFVVQGPDWARLTDLTNEIMTKMRQAGFVTDVNTDVQAGMPEVQIRPDRRALATHAVPLASVSNDLNELFGGLILTGNTEYTKAGHRYEIELRLIASERDKIPDLADIRVRDNRGEVVPFDQLVTKEVKPSLLLISRLNRARAITVYANPAPGHSQDEALARTEKLAHETLPPGYFVKMIGSSQSFRESFRSLVVALLMGILVSYMVLASQFNSFIHPITVLMALPFSVSGAFVGLAIFHQSINMYSMIGLILLMGIVKKNSILLVDFTNQRRKTGMPVRQALLAACPMRLRPILMTSLATIAGAIPAALAIGPGAETKIPMAISIIGGVFASTLLTLLVVPCVYSLMERLEFLDSYKPDLARNARALTRVPDPRASPRATPL